MFLSLALLLVVGLVGCSNPVTPSAGPVVGLVSTQQAHAGDNSVTFAVYGTKSYGYVIGAVVTVTSSAGVEVLTASGPHAQVKATIPASDDAVHVGITYPGFCSFDGDVTVAGTRPSGIWLWIYPGC